MKGSLRVLSYNIHKGFAANLRGGTDKFILHDLKKAVQSTKADVVFLQEVLGEHREHQTHIPHWPEGAQFEFLAEGLWPHVAYGKNAVYTEGHHGNVILSKFPIISWKNIDVSTSRFERRGLLHGILEGPSKKKIHLVCVHLSLLEAARTWQVERLCENLHKTVKPDEPLIIAGDFNDWAEVITPVVTKELKVKEVFLASQGRQARTFPAWLPLFRLDRIYVRGFEILSSECLTKKPWKNLSDHGALFAELQPAEP